MQELKDKTSFRRCKIVEEFQWWVLCRRKYGVIQSFIQINLKGSGSSVLVIE